MARAEFDADLTAPAEARRWVRERIDDWGLKALADSAVLLVSEVVTNAIIHAHSRPNISVAVAEGTLEIGVSDRVSLLPDAPDAVDGAGPDNVALLGEGGRGLLMVALVADSWGAARLDGGKHVYFRLDVDGWEHRGACVCDRPHPASVRLGSGRQVRDLAPGSADPAAL